MIKVLIVIFFSVFNINHDVNMSFVNLDISENDLNIEIRVDKGALEDAFKTHYNVNLNIEDDSEKNMQILHRYFTDHFLLFSGKKAIDISLNKVQNDVEWISIFYKGILPKGAKSITVKNSILVDIVKDQRNIFVIAYNNKNAGYFFTKNNTEATIILNEIK